MPLWAQQRESGEPGFLTTPSPLFLISIDCKGLSICITHLESTLMEHATSVDFKELMGTKSCKMPRVSKIS